MKKKLKFLLLCHYKKHGAATITDNISGIESLSSHDISVVNMLGDLPVGCNLDHFDGLIIHYSLIACYDVYICPSLRIKIRNFSGIKLAFIQDEYRFINDTVAAFKALKINGLFTVVNEEVVDVVYPPEKLPFVRREIVLTGYVPEPLLSLDVPAYQDRSIDVGYRGRDLPFWLGSFAQEKKTIAEKFLVDSEYYKLNNNISCEEKDRIYGKKWIDFIANCKAMLGVESGASVLDFTGEIQQSVDAYTRLHPQASFEEVRDLFFKDVDGKFFINVISPRCFEAAALRTLMVMYEGTYSRRLQAGRHYVVLERNHSNMDEIIHILQTPKLAEEIIDNAYREVALNPINKFSSMVALIDEVIDDFSESLIPKLQVGRNINQEKIEGYAIQQDNLPPSKKQSEKPLISLEKIIKNIQQMLHKTYLVMTPLLAKSILFVTTILPSGIREQFLSFLREQHRYILRRSMEVSNWVVAIDFIGEIFSRQVFSFFGIRDFCNSPTQMMKNLFKVHGLIGYVSRVKQADNVELYLLCDKVTKHLIVFASEKGTLPKNIENYEFLSFSNFNHLIKSKELNLSKIWWRSQGIEGLSKSVPFSGEEVFSFYSIRGDENFFLKLAKYLQYNLSDYIDPINVNEKM